MERNEAEQITFGPKEDEFGKKMNFKDSLEDYMKTVNTRRKDELYTHTEDDCSKICRERGCGRLATIDGKNI